MIAVPTLTTTSISALSTSSATSGGNITADGGASITARGVVWSTSTKPTITLTTKTSDGKGTGSFISTLTNLTPKTTYYIRAYASNSAGTGYGNEISFITSDSTIVMGIPCPGSPTVKDIDWNTYNTVQIGAQCWTKENLRVTKYRDGTVIPLDESGGLEGTGSGQTSSSRTIGARTVYGHNAGNLATYGYLYNWYAATDTKGLCPSGWNVPSEAEWNSLSSYLGNDFGVKLADTSWILAFGKPTNESGFSIKPGGYRDTSGRFSAPLISGNFWSTTKSSSNIFKGRELYSKGYWNTYSYYGASGLSVRCLKDSNSIVSKPTLTTTAITAITTTSSTSGGNITADGGASITARGVVWSTSTNPTIAISTKTSNGTGTGSFSSSLTNLTPKTTYYVRAYVTNSAGTGYGNEISFTTSDSTIVMGIPCPGIPSVKDIDGNTYNTVQIGTQCWTKENLRVTKYRDGTVIPLDESGGVEGNGSGQTWSSRTTGARTVYAHSAANLATYGYLYNWYAATDTKGLCPSGWHVPTDAEWTTLTTYLGGESIAGGKMKSTGTTFWDSPNTGATNESGFSALPSGIRNNYSIFNGIRNTTFFWIASEFNNESVKNSLLYSNYSNVDRSYSDSSIKVDGASVRCLKDTTSIVFKPSLTTTVITAINTTSATSGGNITADGGAAITDRGVVWSPTTNPTIALSTKTTDGTGTGSFSSTLYNLTPKTTYYVRAYATNSAGTGYGNEITFTTSDSSIVMGIPCPGKPTVKDIDGNTYNTVQIGTQCWTKENLKVSRYRNGNTISVVSDNTAWSNLVTGARCWYGNDSISYEDPYGNLYNWYATSDSRGICPIGWHVPINTEWTNLINYLGGDTLAGGKMKSIDTAFWNSPNTGATNESGFSALPGGFRNYDGSFNNGSFRGISVNAFFWSAAEGDGSYAWYRALNSSNDDVNRSYSLNYTTKSVGASVRCLKDTFSVVSIPSLTTTAITAINTTSAISGGNITSDGGASISARGVVWSTSTNPTIALTTKTSDGTGTGSFSSTLSNLTPKTTYYVRAYATNSTGTGYGNEITFTTAEAVMNIPCPGTPTVKDIDGNTYNTVQIGTQCWTKENLRVTKYRDGTVIPLDESNSIVGEQDIWQDITIGARSIYQNNMDYLRDYGYLYNGYSVLDSKGICPVGWHIPANSEWSELINYLGGQIVAGGKMKSTGRFTLINSSVEATNESGFSALPGGYRVFNGAFNGIKGEAFLWSLSYIPYSESNLFTTELTFSTNNSYFFGMWKFMAASIRCLKDTSLVKNSPTVSTDSSTIQNLLSTSSGGLVISDGGSSILARGVVWSSQPFPTISLNTKTINGNGTGSFVSILDNLLPNKKYYYRAYATNSIGTSYGNELSFITPDSINWTGKACYRDSIVKDIDGNIYNNVQIGNQCWLRENLRVARYQDGSVIPFDESGGVLGNDSNQSWGNRIEGSRTIYANNLENLETYGYLYNWYAMVDGRGICPKGWHIPSNEEWNILIKQLDSQADLISNSFQSEVAGGKLKSTGTTFWSSPNKGATDESGFHALPGGFRSSKGSFYGIGSTAYYWSTTKVQGGIGAWHRKLTFFEGNIKRSADVSSDQSKSLGFSARCLMD